MIGEQCWMKENLRTKHFADGTDISLMTLVTSGWNNSHVLDNIHSQMSNNFLYYTGNGAYYYSAHTALRTSSYASLTGNVQGVCPDGWHIPSLQEWQQLEDYVGSQSEYCCSSNPLYIGKALASKSGWNAYDGTSSEYECLPAYSQSTNDATGFSAEPFGRIGYSIYLCRASGYESPQLGGFAQFWSSSYAGETTSYGQDCNLPRISCFSIDGSGAGSGITGLTTYACLNVRCLKD